MKTTDFLTQLRKMDVNLWLEGERLRCQAPRGVLDSELQQQIEERRAEIVTTLRQPAQPALLDFPELQRHSVGDEQPLSLAQERLWFLNQLHPNSSAYNITASWRLEGPLEVAPLRRSLVELTKRHEILRATFPQTSGTPVQKISPASSVPLRCVDLRSVEESARDERLGELAAAEATEPLDLSRGPLFSAAIVTLSDDEHVVILRLPHLLCDGWSVGLLVHDLKAMYAAYSQGRSPSLPELPIRYCDYALWQRRSLEGDRLSELTDFWRRQLEDLPHYLPLPTDFPRQKVHRLQGAVCQFEFSPELTSRVEQLGREARVTPFVTLFAAFGLLLSRYAGVPKFAIGSPFAGRLRSELEQIVGLFVNTLALRFDSTGDPTCRELLHRLQGMLLDVHAHQSMPFEKVVEVIRPDRTLSYSPLFQSVFVLHNTPRAESYSYTSGGSMFDLAIYLRQEAGQIKGAMEYNIDLFDASTIERMISNYEAAATEMAAGVDTPISRLRCVSEAETQLTTEVWNQTATHYPTGKTVTDCFEEQVERYPTSVAVRSGDEHLTYEQLNEQGNRVASWLHERGVGRGSFVGIAMRRSVNTVVAMLGVLKAGGVYLPLDPDYPRERVEFMIADTRPSVMIGEADWFRQLQTSQELELLTESQLGEIRRAETALEKPERTGSPSDLIYVMYTSGSTGVPKGVCVRHRGVVRLVKNTNYFSVTQEDVFLQYAPISFDASTFEIWGSLLNGACLVIAPPELLSIHSLIELVQAEGVSILWLTAGLFHKVVDHGIERLTSVRQLLAGGDVLSPRHVKKALASMKDGVLINGYGPTENTTFTCCHRMTAKTQLGATVPIGKPISNTRVYVLDSDDRPVPMGAVGQLCAAGDGLAAGYLHDETLTQSRFFHSSEFPGERIYRTGDLVRHRTDGTLEFIGRADQQIKIRGFRIEPGEIEITLEQHARIKKAAVVRLVSETHEQKLVAYCEADRVGAPSGRDLRQFLSSRLPSYMVPTEFVLLDELPLTANGKVDRRALPEPGGDRPELEDEFVAPKTDAQVKLAAIWSKLLKQDRIGIYDSFFELGGHSLLAAELFSRIEAEFDIRLPLSTLFHAPNISTLSWSIRHGCFSHDLLIPFRTEGLRTPMFFVHGIGGEVANLKTIGKHLHEEQPLYGLQAGDLRFESIGDLASQYLEHVRSVVREGEMILGGYSLGAVIAYEMAQQLVDDGCTPPLLVVFDSTLPNLPNQGRPNLLRSTYHFVRNMPRWIIDDLLRTPLPQLYHRVVGQLSSRIRRDSDLNIQAVFGVGDLPANIKERYAEFYKAWRAYVPRPYAGHVVLLRGRTPGLFQNHHPNLGWDSMVGDRLTVSTVPGTHASILDDPFVERVAKELEVRVREWQVSAAET